MKGRIKQVGPFSDAPKKDSPTGDDIIAIDDGGNQKRRYVLLKNLPYIGFSLNFGGRVTNLDAGKYFQAFGKSDGSVYAAYNHADQIVCPIDLEINVFTFICSGLDIKNAKIKIHVEQTVEKLITLTASGASYSYGIETGLSVDVTAGQLIAVEYDAVGNSVAMGDTVIVLYGK